MTTREQAQKLLDELPDSELEPVVEFLASRGTAAENGERFGRWLDSRPEEDEEISAEEEAAAAEGRADIAAGRTISHEEMVQKYG